MNDASEDVYSILTVVRTTLSSSNILTRPSLSGTVGQRPGRSFPNCRNLIRKDMAAPLMSPEETRTSWATGLSLFNFYIFSMKPHLSAGNLA